MTPAERQRLHRERQAAGKIVLRVAVDEVDLVEALVESEWLDRRFAYDREAVERAVERLLAFLASIRHA